MISGELTKLTIGGDKGITGDLVIQTAFKSQFQLHVIALTAVFEAACNGHQQLLILTAAALLVKTVSVVSKAVSNGHDHHRLVMNMTGDHRHMTLLKGVTGNMLRGVASNGHQQLHMPTVVAVAVAVVREASSNAKHQL
jgi:hypothetical protein